MLNLSFLLLVEILATVTPGNRTHFRYHERAKVVGVGRAMEMRLPSVQDSLTKFRTRINKFKLL